MRAIPFEFFQFAKSGLEIWKISILPIGVPKEKLRIWTFFEELGFFTTSDISRLALPVECISVFRLFRVHADTFEFLDLQNQTNCMILNLHVL